MATVTSLASATKITDAHTSLTTGATVTVASGDVLVIFLGVPNSGAGGAAVGVTMDDSDGLNTYTQRKVLNRDPGASGDGMTLFIYTCSVTDTVSSGTITASYDTGVGSSAIQVYRVRPATNEVISYDSVGAGNTGNASSWSAGAVSVTNGDIIFGGSAARDNQNATGDSDTTNGSWSTIVNRNADKGTDSSSTLQASQYKEVTATGSQTWTATSGDGTAKQYAADYIIINVDKKLAANTGSYTLSGTAATPKHGWVVTAAAGSYVLTGTAVTLSATGAKAVNAQAGQYDITGTDASPLQGYKPTAAAGSYDVTGTDATPLHQWVLDATTAATYTITGTDAAPKMGFKVDATTGGSYALTGTDVALQRSNAKSITALAGSYAMTGTDATPIHGYLIAAAAGSYAVTGTDAALSRTHAIFLDAPGSYLLTGTSAILTKEATAQHQTATLVGAPYSHSLILSSSATSLSSAARTFSLPVRTTRPSLSVPTYTFTLKVRS